MDKRLFQDLLEGAEDKYDPINAIGVIFHVVDDAEWKRGLAAVASSLEEGAHLFVNHTLPENNNLIATK